MVVGAHALAVHGFVRATGDLDIWIRPDPENAQRIWNALVRFGAPVEAMGLTVRDLASPGVVYQVGLPPRRIDVLTQISGVTFDEAWQSRLEADLDGRAIPIIGRDAFLKNKRAAGRPKDLADAARLESKKR